MFSGPFLPFGCSSGQVRYSLSSGSTSVSQDHRPVFHRHEWVQRKCDAFADVSLVTENLTTTHKARAATGIHGLVECYAAFPNEHALEIAIEDRDANVVAAQARSS